MKLPDNSIGITDILKFMDCPRRFAHGMQRHVTGKEAPEEQHPDTMYGTIFHDTVELVEAEELTDDQALDRAFAAYAPYLGPDDMEKLKLDLETYRERDNLGVRTLANEKEIKVALMEWDCQRCEGAGEGPSHQSSGASTRDIRTCPDCDGTGRVTIYYRGRIDRLYQRLDNPGVFIHRDYKSSKWRKSEEEIHSDKQLWAYNWAIFEYWPEVDHLEQIYDGLRHGAIPTRKSQAQRDQMKEWLVREVTAILEAPEEPEPKFNQWCPWCVVREDCPIIERLTKFEADRIATLLPADQDPDPERIGEYTERLTEVKTAVKTLEAYVERVNGVLKELPADRREELGFKLTGRSSTAFEPEAMRAIHEELGDEAFYGLVKLSQSSIKEMLKGDPDLLERLLAMASHTTGSQSIRALS